MKGLLTEGVVAVGIAVVVVGLAAFIGRQVGPHYRVLLDDGATAKFVWCSDVAEAKGTFYCLHRNQEAQERYDAAHVIRLDTLR
jgi:hypothetical protein